MRYPAFLKKGGTIGLIAPSFGVFVYPYEDKFNNAYKKFSNLEIEVSEGKKKDSYEVLFYKGALYMSLEREKGSDIAHGEFIPKNSILSFERRIDCRFF